MSSHAALPAVSAVSSALGRHGPARARSWLVGEPCFEAPACLRRSLVASARSGSFHYGPPAGLRELRRLLADPRWSGAPDATAEHLTVTHGAKSAVLLALAAIVDAGDEVLCPVPCFPSYPQQIRALGARVVSVPGGDGGGGVDRAALESLVTRRSKALLLSSPCNPCGRSLGAGQGRELVELCRERGITMICDEVYEAFRYRADAPSTAACADPERQVVVQVRSMSKSLALCGWRMGYVVSSPTLARQLAARQGALLNPPSTSAQEALLRLDEVPGDYRPAVRQSVRQRCRELAAVLSTAGFRAAEPDGGFYLWFDLRDRMAGSGCRSSAAWCESFAASTGHGWWPGEDFFRPGWVRVSAVTPREDQWSDAIGELATALQRFG